MFSAIKTKGFTLVEMVVYVALVALVILAVTDTYLVTAHSYRSVKVSRAIDNAAVIALERLTREIRGAKDVDLGQSAFDLNPGRLVLNKLDEAGNPVAVEFFLTGSSLHIKTGGTDEGALHATEVAVTNLVFRFLPGSQSQAVRVELRLQSGTDSALKTRNFYSTIVLRGSYASQS